MNLLHIISSMDPTTGGPCQGIRNSNDALSKQGVQREVICLDDPAAAYLGHDEFTIHALGPVQGTWKYSKNLIPWLLKNFHRFDVIVINGLWQYHAYATDRALKIFRKQVAGSGSAQKVPKLFVMPHGMLDPYFQRAESRKLKAVRNWFYWKIIEKRVINNAEGLLFTCEEELRLARQTFSGYRPKQELNVGYGIVEPTSFIPAMRQAFLKNCPELNSGPYLLFLSRIHPKKGVDLLLRAYTTLLTNPEISQLPQLVIAGPGLETEYGVQMRQLARQIESLGGIVHFTGMLSGDAKWGALYGCEGFILPSHQENFGIVVAEALACAKPVLISNQVNIWREIELAGAGIVEGDDLIGTTAMLNSWLALTDQQKSEMSENGHACYVNSFETGPAAEKFLKAISPATEPVTI